MTYLLGSYWDNLRLREAKREAWRKTILDNLRFVHTELLINAQPGPVERALDELMAEVEFL